MRRVIRAELRDGTHAIAVVCEAHHAPALDPARFPPVSRDNALLSKLPRMRVAAQLGGVDLRRAVLLERLRCRRAVAGVARAPHPHS